VINALLTKLAAAGLTPRPETGRGDLLHHLATRPERNDSFCGSTAASPDSGGWTPSSCADQRIDDLIRAGVIVEPLTASRREPSATHLSQQAVWRSAPRAIVS